MPSHNAIARARCRAFESLQLQRYPDAKGWSIGYGHHFRRKAECPETVTVEQAEGWFNADWQRARRDAAHLLEAKAVTGVRQPCLTRVSVIAEMCFQMGRPRVSRFKRFWKAMARGDHDAAAAEMMFRSWPRDTRPTPWHRDTPARCRRLAAIMITGADRPD